MLCVRLQRPALNIFKFRGSGRRGRRSRRLSLSTAHHPSTQAPPPEDTPRGLPGERLSSRALGCPRRHVTVCWRSSGGGLSGRFVGHFHSGETKQEGLLQTPTLSWEVDQCLIRPPHPDRPPGQVISTCFPPSGSCLSWMQFYSEASLDPYVPKACFRGSFT